MRIPGEEPQFNKGDHVRVKPRQGQTGTVDAVCVAGGIMNAYYVYLVAYAPDAKIKLDGYRVANGGFWKTDDLERIDDVETRAPARL